MELYEYETREYISIQIQNDETSEFFCKKIDEDVRHYTNVADVNDVLHDNDFDYEKIKREPFFDAEIFDCNGKWRRYIGADDDYVELSYSIVNDRSDARYYLEKFDKISTEADDDDLLEKWTVIAYRCFTASKIATKYFDDDDIDGSDYEMDYTRN